MNVALLAFLAACERAPLPQHIEVVSGDTLSKLAAARGCTVDQLRVWNGIDGDLIEVGQQLAWFPERCSDASTPSARPRKAPPSRPQPARGGLVLPPEKPCLGGPDPGELADAGMAASEGLTAAQASQALSAFVHHALPCIGDASPRESLELELVVACTGRVSDVRVAARHDWPPEVADCVSDTLRYTPFPAHGLPDGDLIRYPMRYTPAE